MSATLLTIGPTSGGAGTGQVDLTVTFTLNASSEATSYQLKNTFSPVYVQPKNLAAGANTISIPTSPQTPGGVLIVPQAESTYSATLKGVVGDTGIVLNKNAPTLITFATAPAASFDLAWGGKGYNNLAVVADPATDKITVANTFVAGDRVKFGGTAVPGGLTAGQWYYVINPAAGDFEVSASVGGSKVDISDTGTAVTITSADQFKFYWI